MYLLNMNQNNNGDIDTLPSGVRVYSCEIYDDDTLIRNYIPCYSKTTVTNADGNSCSTGTIGLYDKVENKFYTNKGSGTFTKGNDV